MSQSNADRAAAAAVVAHHTQLAADSTRHVAAVRDAACQDTGMHTLLGTEEAPGSCGGGGGEGGCGCGGDTGRADVAAPVLSLDARVDVRGIPHDQRHARVLTAVDALPADAALVLIAPHAPRPLLAEIDARYPGQIDITWLQEGPDVWQIRLYRQPLTV
ncbi:DUF2249 domain-containing protein [Dactylosporangium roseum]|uniref:DUF2249 domain-containing protein n=1 Tax=Dactylosporangium roseum TaxID=47989 RepID=A0ABY5Z427_9ACTN|nr:DUF2249 domain-containing protein [Dactylosporangium roseum]UWZ36587.1 DUF2249 domain-containing protein [Dactylosporangium roseum]